MPVLAWKGEFETGIAYLDYEHRRLVELINCICASLEVAGAEAAVADGLGQLYAQIAAHFAIEEHLMRANGYALYHAHKEDHERLLDEIRYMMDAYAAGECENCGKTLDDCLGRWFLKHFQVTDARFEGLRSRH